VARDVGGALAVVLEVSAIVEMGSSWLLRLRRDREMLMEKMKKVSHFASSTEM